MTFSSQQIGELSAPLDPANVKKNPRGYDYVEAYHAENEANRIFGFSSWDRFTQIELIGEREFEGKQRVYYRAKCKIVVRTPNGETVVREGCGYGSGIDKDLGQAHESALKEAESDAEKRALKTFGNPFGQALYDKDKTQVAAPASPAADFAIANMRTCATADHFKDFWAKNKDGLKEQLTRAEYERVVAAMRDEAKRFAPTDTPFEQKEAA